VDRDNIPIMRSLYPQSERMYNKMYTNM